MLVDTHRYRIGTIGGIPLYVGSSWPLIAGLYLYLQFLRLQGSADSGLEAAGFALVGAVLFFGSVLVHEGAHAAVARALGIPVAGITLVFWGGATEARADVRGPLGEFLVSAVGPASTLLLAAAFRLVAGELSGTMGEIVRDLAALNVLFAILNALPGFPLDGGRMLLALAWGLSGSRGSALRVAGWVGVGLGAACGAGAVWAFTNRTGLWFILAYLAFLLIATGRQMDGRVALADRLRAGTVADAMAPPSPAIPASMSLSEALDRHLRAERDRSFPVVDDGRVIGTVSLASARRAGARNPLRPVRDGLVPLRELVVVSPEEPLDRALEWIGGREALVLRDGVLVGRLAAADVQRWYRRRFEPTDRTQAGPPVPPRPDG
ncbi:MAG: zinc metalloprotease [Actinomycetota bacterium]|nr:MAG: zinc metalloprotease [Actinomycetota bacterium]